MNQTAAPDRRMLGMAGTVLLLHAAGWGLFLVAVLPHGYRLGNNSAIFGIGVALTAYLLGARHAFDPDHIAAIDNTTRRLIDRAEAPASAGFWFALGHSSIVIAAVALVAAGFNGITGQLADDGSLLKQFAGVWGPFISGCFLLFIGTMNLVALTEILRAAKLQRLDHAAELKLERSLSRRGVLTKFLAPVAARVDKPWKLYPLGMLFGLGLDTATTIALFVVAGGAVVVLPWHVIMVLPILFTAGMVLCDTLNGIMMSRVYRRTFDRPLRRIFYNVAVTSASVVVAFLVAAVVLSGLAADLLDVQSGPIAWVAAQDLGNAGFLIVGLFLLTWLVTVAAWKLGRFEEHASASTPG